MLEKEVKLPNDIRITKILPIKTHGFYCKKILPEMILRSLK